MSKQFQKFWDKTLQPNLQKFGVDVKRYPPEPAPRQIHWTEVVFDLILKQQADFCVDDITAEEDFIRFCMQHSKESHSQLFQDLFVRWHFQDKMAGYFVEFGATDGVSLSNSKSLEGVLGWQGILAEPARCWHKQLRQNRSCTIDTRCVWTTTGLFLEFKEVSVPELSTVNSFSTSDSHAAARMSGELYSVETVSLTDLLHQNGAPTWIDYLSIDTEGSEYEILKQLNFQQHGIGLITVEHNYTPNRGQIFDLLTQNGFDRVFSQFSKWDDWYVNRSQKFGK